MVCTLTVLTLYYILYDVMLYKCILVRLNIHICELSGQRFIVRY